MNFFNSALERFSLGTISHWSVNRVNTVKKIKETPEDTSGNEYSWHILRISSHSLCDILTTNGLVSVFHWQWILLFPLRSRGVECGNFNGTSIWNHYSNSEIQPPNAAYGLPCKFYTPSFAEDMNEKRVTPEDGAPDGSQWTLRGRRWSACEKINGKESPWGEQENSCSMSLFMYHCQISAVDQHTVKSLKALSFHGYLTDCKLQYL